MKSRVLSKKIGRFLKENMVMANVDIDKNGDVYTVVDASNKSVLSVFEDLESVKKFLRSLGCRNIPADSAFYVGSVQVQVEKILLDKFVSDSKNKWEKESIFMFSLFSLNYSILEALDFYEQDLWVQNVKIKRTAPKGLFSKSPEEIADYHIKDSPDLNVAKKRLIFVKNRAGRTMSREMRAAIDKAIDIIDKRKAKQREA